MDTVHPTKLYYFSNNVKLNLSLPPRVVFLLLLLFGLFLIIAKLNARNTIDLYMYSTH